MSDREQLPELIDRFTNGSLTGEELASFLEVLKTNPRLREEVRLDHELNDILANQDILELRQRIIAIQKTRHRRKGPDLQILLLAASILLLIGIEVLLLLNKTYRANPVKNPVLITKHQPGMTRKEIKDKVIIPETETPVPDNAKYLNDYKKKTELSSNFRKNPAFENMIGTTRHALSFRMDAPSATTCYHQSDFIRFEWMIDDQAEINLIIMNNTGVTVHESPVLTKNRYSLPPGSLKNGLYYFKVMHDDEILYFGKFLVK
ncbi:MAG: hypothetical protein NTW10_08820 [Bacteroidetes bacterium]|nr:hypothetical protein [Bacteroidota bacterium]